MKTAETTVCVSRVEAIMMMAERRTARQSIEINPSLLVALIPVGIIILGLSLGYIRLW